MTKKITYQRSYNITLYYLSRFDASSGKVKEMLKRRALRAKQQGLEIPTEYTAWIGQIIERMVELGYIDDRRYGENQVRLLSSQGKSTRFIAMKLTQSGLESDLIESLIENSTSTEFERAKRLVERKKMGHLRPQEQQSEYYKKDLAALGRAGFSYEIATKVLKGNEEY